MKIVDLSQDLFDGMPVYPGDPEVEIEQVHTLANEGWRLRSLSLNTHLGTHVNVSSHMVSDGKSLSELDLECFMGKCTVYTKGMSIDSNLGYLFLDENINASITDTLIAGRPRFIGLSEEHDFDIDLERKLLGHGIISYENLTNVEKLPREKVFDFYAAPLKIKEADGSPVRAFAVVQ